MRLLMLVGLGGFSPMIFMMVDPTVSPSKGNLRVKISNIITPKEKIDLYPKKWRPQKRVIA
jgi:hypothetical protein